MWQFESSLIFSSMACRAEIQ
uniref:Uncharacterized protein n=1 Tax=Arundo donax TaxID=35708 RepID=A0A0A9F882_ARUDO